MNAVLTADPAPATDTVDAAYAEFCRGYRRLLVAIGEHDRCETYRVLGLRSEQDYLCRTFDLRWPTAKDWIREARLIGLHPEIGDRLATGTLSVDSFRKMAEMIDEQSPESLRPKGPFDNNTGTGPNPDPGPNPNPSNPDPDPDPDPGPGPDPDPRPEPDSGGDIGGCANPGPEAGPPQPDAGPDPTGPDPDGRTGQDRPPTLAELMAMLDDHTARQLAAKAAAAREEAARKRERRRTRHLKVVRADSTGRLSIKDGELYDDDAAVVWAAFADYANRTGKNPETGTWDPADMRNADALRAMAEAYLARRERDLSHPLVVFHADARVLTHDPHDIGWAAVGDDHSPLTVDTIRQLACFSKINLALDDPDGNPLYLGRTQRLASWQQEYMVIWRDGGCRGCGSTVGLEVHHLQEWTADHGLTDADQMIAACRVCHHLQHDSDWHFDGDPNHQIRLHDPTGDIRCQTNPHPRYQTRPRPPKDWLTDPPPPTNPNTPAREPEPDDTPTLW